MDLAWFREQQFRWVVRTDFKDCFDSLDHDVLLARFTEEIDDSEAVDFVRMLLNRPIRAPNGKTVLNADEVGLSSSGTEEGISQGGPLSPMLTNLYLDAFDEAMVIAGVPILRYADDMVLLGRSKREARATAELAHTTALRLGVELNKEKTLVTSFEEGFAFLGEDIGPVHPVRELSMIGEGDLLKKALYVTLQGSGVRVASGQVIVNHGEEELLRAPQSLISHIVLIGSVGLSAGARSMALYEGVPVSFLSRRGRYLGRLDGAERPRASLRRRQYRAGDDPGVRLEIARGFVLGKIANQRTLVQRYTRRRSIPTLVGSAKSLKSSRREARRSQSIPELLGVEGSASRCYFNALALLLPDDSGFAARRRRPPKDPVNAALGYAYAVLAAEAESALSTVGLDPVAGFLHADHEKRPSLALDLMEEFRPLVVDSVVLDLFRRRRLEPAAHFRREESGVFMNREGRTALMTGLEERMLTIFSHAPSGKRVTYRRAITLQAQQVVNVLEGRIPTYEPVPWR